MRGQPVDRRPESRWDMAWTQAPREPGAISPGGTRLARSFRLGVPISSRRTPAIARARHQLGPQANVSGGLSSTWLALEHRLVMRLSSIVRPIRPDDPTEYVVRTLFSNIAQNDGPDHGMARPVAVVNVIAVHEGGRWVFANVLSRATDAWSRQRVGPITYVIEPGLVFHRERADAAVRFADSLSTAFNLPRLSGLTYYLSASPETMQRIRGVDWSVMSPATPGGIASYRNRQIFVADPRLGEEYRHELAHFIMAPLMPPGGSHAFVNEGVATWLGGTLGMTPAVTRQRFAEFLRANPAVTLDSALESEGSDRGFRPGGAVLSAMVFEHGGPAGIRQFMSIRSRPGPTSGCLPIARE